ncbi:restriction endonuclease subunit S [Mycobacteroides abscessus]|uniref:restriction endonuclease subunit S n=1 Tax=Mycobacteroides abscessus TaxID=36809 RepID=UPI00025882B0|nr:restriction endonuclease subunit S [Mycobacteroides abscessus]EIC62273.1 type I restriction-modification system specificity subunit [Mycobacteroides abscessus M94]SKZ50661.1 Restriction enzyme BgcI subunit beta [Mycobacteroides abscessus subsp. abscessus]
MTQLSDIFDLRYGHSLELNALSSVSSPDGVNFVSRAMRNNGVTARVLTDAEPGKGGEITVALGGNGVLSSFVQPEPFVCGRDVMILTAKNPQMTTVEKLWWCRCIWENRFRFSYGRQANRTLGSLVVPDDVPTWVTSMEIPTHEGLSQPAGSPVALTPTESWRLFPLDGLFTVKKGRRVTKANREAGSTRFIGASEKNNGITDFCDLEPNFQPHCLTVPYNGNSVGVAFYQDQPFFACDDVQVLVPKSEVSRLALLFVAAVIRFERSRFTYGYKWNLARMKKTQIRLPANQNGEPDWGYMDTVMRGLPFSGVLSPLEDAA